MGMSPGGRRRSVSVRWLVARPLILGPAVLAMVVVVGLVTTTPALGGQVPVGQASWPAFHHGVDRNALNPQEATLSATNIGSLQVSWSVQTGANVVSSPTVV